VFVDLKKSAHTIEQFEKVNLKNEKISIDLDLLRMRNRIEDLQPLAKYQIKKLSIVHEKFYFKLITQIKRYLTFLTEIYMKYNNSSRVDNELFDFISKSQIKLDLSVSSEIDLRVDYYNKLVNNLESLRLGRFMTKKDFDLSYLSGLTNLKHLTFYSSFVRPIRADTFKSLVHLQSLDLSRSSIDAIHPGTFDGLANLTSLCLDNNLFRILKDHTFRGLQNLQRLSVAGIQDLREIEPDAFAGLGQLENLNLSFNRLTKLVASCTPKIVNLSNNKNLNSIRFTAKDLSRIQVINLSGNRSELVDFESIFGAYETINLQEMGISFEALSSNATFSHLKSLKELEIHKLGDSSAPVPISKNMFHGLHDLVRLELIFQPERDYFAMDESPVEAEFYECNKIIFQTFKRFKHLMW
jgi:hypothetical protein